MGMIRDENAEHLGALLQNCNDGEIERAHEAIQYERKKRAEQRRDAAKQAGVSEDRKMQNGLALGSVAGVGASEKALYDSAALNTRYTVLNFAGQKFIRCGGSGILLELYPHEVSRLVKDLL